MRKRSEVAEKSTMREESYEKAQADEDPVRSTAEPVYDTTHLPPGCSVEDNVFFIKCSECGMHQGFLMAKQVNGRAHCFKCDHPFHPILTRAYADAARAAVNPKKQSATSHAPEPKVEPKQEPKGRPPSPFEQCEQCGEKLTVTELGKFYPCGHDKRKEAPPPLKAPPSVSPKTENKPVVVQSEGTVTVLYGKETFTPKPYNTFEIGPFSMTTSIQPGESIQQACDRVYGKLRDFANIEFARKLKDFVDRLKLAADAID